MSRSHKLTLLNHHFYETIADSFSKSRSTPWDGFIKCLDWIANNDTVLDLGCGNGRFISFIREHNKMGSYVGVDNSAELLSFVPQLPNVKYETDTIHDWILKHQTMFDCITLFGVLHHISSEQELLDLLDYAYHHSQTVILSRWNCVMNKVLMSRRIDPESLAGRSILRSEERRVGKEC